jgi:F-type H+-transporting ATPase subunit delta
MQSNYKYAKTLFDLSKQTNSVNKIKNELKAVAYLYNKVSAFRLVLITKRINAENKSNIICNALNKFEPLIVEFVLILIKNNQTNNLLDIIMRFNNMCSADFNMNKISVTTANKLSDSQLDNIANIIYSKIGFKPEIDQFTDSELIGGIKLRIGNKIFDNSVSYQINQLKKTLHNM